MVEVGLTGMLRLTGIVIGPKLVAPSLYEKVQLGEPVNTKLSDVEEPEQMEVEDAERVTVGKGLIVTLAVVELEHVPSKNKYVTKYVPTALLPRLIKPDVVSMDKPTVDV